MQSNSLVKKIIDFIAYSNISISAAAASYAAVSYIQFRTLAEYSERSDWYNLKLILFIFCATFCSYSFHRLFPILNNSLKFESKIINWTKCNLKFMLVCFIISGLALLYLFMFHLNQESKLLLCLLAFTTVLYTIPLFKRNGRALRLRDFAYSKIFLIGATWGLVCATLPMVNESSKSITFLWTHLTFSFLEKCFFIIAITLPFDIRDLEYDKIEQVATIPTKLGVSKTILLALVLLFISFSIVMILYDLNFGQIIAFSLAYTLTACALFISKREQKDHFYFLAVDGLPIALLLLLIILSV